VYRMASTKKNTKKTQVSTVRKKEKEPSQHRSLHGRVGW